MIQKFLDRTANGLDSRYGGYIPLQLMVGKGALIYFSWDGRRK